MNTKARFQRNTVLLTAFSLLISAAGMVFQVWLAGAFRPEGLGLYTLSISVCNLAATVAISGIRFASTRLVAEELGLDRAGSIRSVMKRCLRYAAFWGLLAGAALALLSDAIGIHWIGDGRICPSLRISSFSMPCIALCASLSGYFTACGRIWKPALVHLLEQFAGMLLSALFLRRCSAENLSQCCAAVTLGRTGADLLSLVLMLLVYGQDRKKHYPGTAGGAGLTGRMLRIAMPLAASAYARSALTTLRQVLTPKGLRAAGLAADRALAGYGVLQGMVLPMLLFPSCILASAAELIVPALTAFQVRQHHRAIKSAAGELLRRSLWYSLAVGAGMLLFSDELGLLFYQSREAGRYLRLLAPLVPVMYTDMVTDGCLRGLGQQLWSMGVNVAEGILGILMALTLLPRWGLTGYLILLYAAELFNLSMSLVRLRQVLRPFSCGGRRPGASGVKSAYTVRRSAPIPPRPSAD